MTNGSVDRPDGGTHGFLFADLRGYTRLVDSRGAAEASRLLDRYRFLTREIVGQYGGAEIKTEGDSFYLVLPSASAALRCGLALIAACAAPPDGGEPIEVGVGVHAGEAVAHEGGFVGSAVNIAARICSVAAAGELLASGTIRELTRSIVAAQFVSVGRRQLKGLPEPVELFRVLPEGAATSVRRRPRETAPARRPLRLLAAAAIVMAVVVAGAVTSALLRPASGASVDVRSASPTASPGQVASQPAASPSVDAGVGRPTASSEPSASEPVASPSVLVQRLPRVGERIEPGTYAPNVNPDAVSVTITGSGWTLAADSEDLLFFEDPVGVSGVGLARITVVWTGPCPDDPTRLLGDRPKDLIDWVQSTPQLEASQLHSVIDLGLYGIGINATVLPHLTGPCGTRLPSRSWLWGVSGGSWNPNTGTRIFFEALYDGSRTLTVVFAAPDAAALSTFDTGPGRQLLASIGLRR